MVRTDKGKKFVNKTFQDSYVLPLHRGHGIGNFLSGLFRADRPVRWSGGKEFGKATLKALGNEALRTGVKILMGIADNPTLSAHDII